MNQKLEIKKIKVNNGQELINKAKEYKNSGGEWKLRERYLEMPIKGIGKRKNKLGWGIVISNGKQTIDIFSTKHNVDYEELVEEDLVRLDECNARPELWRLFPKAQYALDSGNEGNKKMSATTHKELKKDNEPYALKRYLVAENSWHLKQILHEYVRENEGKVYQSTNPHFSSWAEIIDGQDGNIYLYVGEKNDNGGREIKIGIKKEEFYSKKDHNFYAKSGGGYYSAEEMLKMAWNLFTINRPRTPAETREYYSSDGGLEEEWKRNWPHRRKLCRKYLEELRNRMTEKFNYWQEKTRQKDYWDHEANEQGILARSHIAEIDNELADMKKNHLTYYDACDKNCSVCGIKLCFHYEGQACSGSKKRLLFYDDHGGDAFSLERSSGSEKLQILQYFIVKDIKKITLDNGKLVIEYNDNTKKTVESKDQQLQKCYQFIQTLPSQSLSFSELQEDNVNNHDSTPDKNNTGTYIFLTIGVFILGGIFVYFFARKEKNK